MKEILAIPVFYCGHQGGLVFLAFSGIGILLFLYKILHFNF
jgi:hypothetical protein